MNKKVMYIIFLQSPIMFVKSWGEIGKNQRYITQKN